MKVQANGLIYVTEREFQALQDLYNNANEAFNALPAQYREAFWTAVYQPCLRLKELPHDPQ